MKLRKTSTTPSNPPKPSINYYSCMNRKCLKSMSCKSEGKGCFLDSSCEGKCNSFIFDSDKQICVEGPCEPDNCFSSLEECKNKIKYCCKDDQCEASINCEGKIFDSISTCKCNTPIPPSPSSKDRISYDNYSETCFTNTDYVPKRGSETVSVFSGSDNMWGKDCNSAPRIKAGSIPYSSCKLKILELKPISNNKKSKGLPFETAGMVILSFDHEENLQLLPDEEALRVTYGSSKNPTDPSSKPTKFGSQFWWAAFPDSAGLEGGILTYSIRFPANFLPVYGGKLPGVFGFNSQNGSVKFNQKSLSHCTGSNPSNGINCWSIRPMWRHGMVGEALAVIPVDLNKGRLYDDADSVVLTSCTKSYGCDLSRGSFRWPACSNADEVKSSCEPTNTWYKIKQYVNLNTVTNSTYNKDGKYMLSITGPDGVEKVVINIDGMVYRTSGELKFNGLVFSTFYGGGSEELYGPPSVTNIDFKDFSIQTFQC